MCVGTAKEQRRAKLSNATRRRRAGKERCRPIGNDKKGTCTQFWIVLRGATMSNGPPTPFSTRWHRRRERNREREYRNTHADERGRSVGRKKKTAEKSPYPVLDCAEGGDNEERPAHALPHKVAQEGDALDGLAQTHLIPQDAVKPVLPQRSHPLHPRKLVVSQHTWCASMRVCVWVWE